MKLLLIFVVIFVIFQGIESKRPSYCDLPLEHGPCTGTYVKYGFDRAISKCREFFYGGCKGNRNRFDTARACYSACESI